MLRKLGSALFGTTLGNYQTRKGAEYDMKNQKSMFDYRIKQGLEHGMTPYEMFMGPAAGGGGGTSNIGQTMGNQANDQMKQAFAMNQETKEKEKDRQTSVQIAEIQAGASKYNTDVQKAIADGRLGFDNKVYQETTAPAAALKMGLTTQQVLKAANEVVTSSPKFLKLMKTMTMSAENILATMTAFGLPVDYTNPEAVKKMTESEREQVVAAILGLLSNSRKEMTGVGEYFKSIINGFKDVGLPPMPTLGKTELPFNRQGGGDGW